MTNEEMIEDLKQFIAATVSQSTSDIREEVFGLDQKVTSLDQKVTSLDQKVTSLDQKVTSLDQKVTRLEATTEEIDTKLDTFMNAVGENQEETDKRLTHLETKVFAS
jgi:peptidoglycan hydrolase CwlO-like protein